MFVANRNAIWESGTYQGAFAEDHITFKSMASADGKLRVPTAGLSQSGGRGCPYNWFISVDGGEYQQFVGTGSTSNNLVVAEGLPADSEHVIDLRIFDIENQYGRARAFGWYQSGIADRLTELIVDSCYLGFAQSAESTGNYFRSYQYCGCTNLRNAYNEYIPLTCLDTGVHFRTYQYNGCTTLTRAGAESCPNSVLEIKDWFRQYQYANCSNLVEPAVEVMPDTVTRIGQHFRGHMYENCTSLVETAGEVLPPTLQTIAHDFRCGQYKGCVNLLTASDEVLPDTVTSIADWFRLEQFMNCRSLTTNAKEAMSSSLTSLAYHYRHDQYTNCTSITRLDVKSVPNSLRTHDYCRYDWLCNTGNTTNPMTIYCTGDRVEYGDSSMSLNGNCVDKMYVPANLVQGYRDSWYWNAVADNKIIGY